MQLLPGPEDLGVDERVGRGSRGVERHARHGGGGGQLERVIVQRQRLS